MSDEHTPSDSSADHGLGAEASSPAAVPSGAVVTALADLVRLREAKGFSASLMSSRLRLAPRQIAALEAGDWQALPGRTFIRSSLRSYGRLIDADVTPLLQAIEADLPGGEILKPNSDLRRPMPREGALGFGGGGSGSRWVWLLLLLIGIVALAFFYGGGANMLNGGGKLPVSGAAPASATADNAAGPTEPRTPANRPDPAAAGAGASGPSGASGASGAAAAPGASPAPPATGSAPSGSAAPPLNLPAAAGQRDAPGAQLPALAQGLPAAGAAGASAALDTRGATPAAAQAAATPAPAAAPATAAPGPSLPATPSVVVPRTPAAVGAGAPLNPLVMRFPAESWIEVRDASGAVLITGTQPAGSVRELSGELPLSLTIGNATGVSVTWRGAPVEVAPHIRLGIARFRIE